ncbi:MAG: hypothetical protein LBC82_01270 [Oscillospiraceae bacterium]|jgi:hypothetical protein|nr:hypothetical protein [Oscillospiraceae bacterium]
MLKVKIIPLLARIVSNIDLKPIIEHFKVLDITKDTKKSLTDLDDEQKAVIAFELTAAISPQFEKISKDLPILIAEYKGISLEEAGELDFIGSMKEIFSDMGVISFFRHLLRKKAGPQP